MHNSKVWEFVIRVVLLGRRHAPWFRQLSMDGVSVNLGPCCGSIAATRQKTYNHNTEADGLEAQDVGWFGERHPTKASSATDALS